MALRFRRLDVVENMPEIDQSRTDFLRRKSVKHERVIGIRTMGANDFGRDREELIWGQDTLYQKQARGYPAVFALRLDHCREFRLQSVQGFLEHFEVCRSSH